MRAQVDQKFSSGFVLSEEGLLKLVDIIKNRLCSEVGTPVPVSIDVGRSDHALITYDSVDEVLSEENGKINKINMVRIYSTGDGDKFSIHFEKGENSRPRINSESRDRALLALSDLRDYIKSEVAVRRFSYISDILQSRLGFPMAMVLSMFAGLIYTLSSIRDVELDPPVNPSLEAKIDYLYKSRVSLEAVSPTEIFGPLMGLPILAALVMVILYVAYPYVYQSDLFLWGKEKERVRVHESIKGKVFWTVGIGLVVSIGSGLVIEYMK